MSNVARTEFGDVQRVRDFTTGEPEYLLRCPGCGEWARLDDDQYHGRVSVDHAADGCAGGYHETHDFAVAAERVGFAEVDWATLYGREA